MNRRLSDWWCMAAGLTAFVGGLLCSFAVVARAAEDVADSARPANASFRRLFVPADSPETWPVGSKRFLPMARQEFDRLISQIQTQTSLEQQPPVQVIGAAYRAELFPDDVLGGTAEWTVALPGKHPQLLSLAPLNLVIDDAAWRRDPEKPASIGLWKRSDQAPELAVLVEKADTLHMRWQTAARTSDAAYAEFDLLKPIVVPQTLELLIPGSCSASLTHGELLRTEADASGATRWIFQLAANEAHRLRITRRVASPAANALPFVSQVTSYQLKRPGIDMVTQLRLDARDTQVTELKARLDSELRVATVRIDQQPVAWRVDVVDGISTLIITRPASLHPQAIEIHCLARIRSGARWALPKLRFSEIAWTEGSTSLLVAPDLELQSLTPRQASVQHIVGIAGDLNEGEVFRFQEWSRDAEIEVEVGRPPASLDAKSFTALQLGRGDVQAKASIVAALTSSRSDTYQIQAAVAAGWSIDSVTSTPKSALNEWHIDRQGNSDVLYCQLDQPISDRQALRIEIEASESSGATVLPAAVGRLKIVRILRTTTRRDYLQLNTRNQTQVALAEGIERARLDPDTLPLDFVALANASPSGALIDVSMLGDTELIALRQQPAQYEAQVRIDVDALPDTLRHQYQIDCQVSSGAVSDLELEFDAPLPTSIPWELVGQRGSVTIEPTDSLAELTSADSSVRYLLRLPSPMSSDFRLQASYTEPAQPTEHCNLMRLPRSPDWTGQVLLYGSLDSFQIVDRGWTPTLYSFAGADQVELPLMGAYRIGPAAFWRRTAQPRIQLKRRVAESAVPQLAAWLAEYHTLQSANGAALHIAGYSLENVDAGQAKIVLPAEAQLQEAWLDDQQLDISQHSLEGNTIQIRFGKKQRWPYLALKYSTHEPPLGGSATIQPAVPKCSFPVHLGRWTLWAPEQYEIDSTQQNYSLQQFHWWKRIFGPLARSRGETVFNPSSGASWTALWSNPLAGQRTKRAAEELAAQLVARLNTASEQQLGQLFDEIVRQSEFVDLFCIDRVALLAKGTQPSTSVDDLVAMDRTFSAPKSQALPLTSYQLAFLVSPGMITLTTAERVAHWFDLLRPTEVSGVFVINSDALADHLDELRSARSADIVNVAQWRGIPEKLQPQWHLPSAANLVDVGRRAQTIEFVDGVPMVVVRRAFVQRALWYAIVLLTSVLGVWQLAHYPNFMILSGAIAGASCLIVPTQWLTVPQAVFLGLVGASVARVAIKSAQIGDSSLGSSGSRAHIGTMVLLICLGGQGSAATAQLVTAGDAESSTSEQELPRVLVPIDAHGVDQGGDVYLSEAFLERLHRLPRKTPHIGADFVISTAKYRGSLLPGADSPITIAGPRATDRWNLRWKVISFVPNSSMFLPLRRDEARWDENAHRLDGLPVKLDWRPDGEGCFVVLSAAGEHWLELAAQPYRSSTGRASTIQLRVPPVPGAELDLALAPNIDDLQIVGAGQINSSDPPNRIQTRLGATDEIEIRWSAQNPISTGPSWESLEQLAWLHVGSSVTRLDVRLSFAGLRSSSQFLELDVSTQLKLEAPTADSPIAEVIAPSPDQPRRLRLRLKPGQPADLTVPLRFEFQRAASVGRIFFPRFRLLGSSPTQNLFAVSVSAGLTYDEQASSDLRGIEATEFSALWNTTDEEPLYAYALGQGDPEWSLRVWPDPPSFTVQPTLGIHCSYDVARIDFSALLDDLARPRLLHRLEVPESLRIETITVTDLDDEAKSVPIRWSRASPTIAMVFLGRPLQQAHRIRLEGQLEATSSEEIELPTIRILDGEQDTVRMDLYRNEDVQVDWTNPSRAPQESPGRRIPRNRDEIHVGHFSWRSSGAAQLSKLRMKKNNQVYDSISAITVDFDVADWRARLNSHVVVRQGIVSRFTATVPENFQAPYVLLPEQVGVIDEVQESPDGKVITVALAEPVASGGEIEIRLGGRLNPAADRRLAIPALDWKGVSHHERYVLLPNSVGGQQVGWQMSGLRRHQLPAKLASYAAAPNESVSYRVEQRQFEAKQPSDRGALHNALVRYAKVNANLDADGLMTATAELILQPGRATSCSIRLPPESQLDQLVVGDHPARRNLRDDGSWNVPLGPPFLPQRIVLQYRSRPGQTGRRLQLVPPTILLGDQALPGQQTWWHLRTTQGLQLRTPDMGHFTSKVEFTKAIYQLAQLTYEAGLPQALELELGEGRAWGRFWRAVVWQSKRDWQSSDLYSESDPADADAAPVELAKAFADSGISSEDRTTPLNYPPRLHDNLEAAPTSREYYFVSDRRGQTVLTVARSTQLNLWRWFAAAVIVCGVSAVVLQLRQHDGWHHNLCRRPHSVALVGGFAWWLLLQPSAMGMLVIVLTLVSLTLQQWRSLREHKRQRPGTQLATPTS